MLITSLFCLGFSTTCHLCHCKNEIISRRVCYIDYWGIAILFLGSLYPFISFKYACGPFILWRYIFTTFLTICTIACMIATIRDTSMSPKMRSCMFMTFGFAAMIPTYGFAAFYNPTYTLYPETMRFSWAVIVYITGMFIYILRAPERWSNLGKFDIWGGSHQIFHCFVLAGIALTFWDALCTYQERLAFVCPD